MFLSVIPRRAQSLFVIPGRAQREPGIHNHSRPDSTMTAAAYGFRAPTFGRPRNDDRETA